MRVMHLVLTPRFSGAEILVRDLCIAQKNMGHDVAFSAINPSEESFLPQLERLQHAGVHVQLPHQAPSHLQRLPHIRKLLIEFKPDVVFAHSVIPAMYARLADLLQRRVVPVLHATDNYPAVGPHRLAEHLLCHLSRNTIAVSEPGADNYRAVFPVPVRVIRNGLDFTGAQAAAAHRRKRTEKSGIVLQVGRVLPLKGQHISIQAMAEVVKQQPQARLWLAGLIEDKEYHEKLKLLTANLGLQLHVEFLGPRQDIFDLLARADVYVMPSSAESQGLAMLEALATGTPVIASDIPTLAQFSKMKGVQCIPRESVADWERSILSAFKEPIYLPRNISDFDINRTATEYLDLTEAQLEH
ncbi:glycosyltransferase [Pseudomonas oryzae]|uniref:Glycosyltransferase involved in cell wall bisynthesis n=1 Tax=Pseudomonas oryzae TaxID=1392877 RepID=A0A1H1M724_9PSED|nr:glycosyltransferase [Pseudomonas oryzae]SDR82322.1 Glycosyltransferase involved in cell wall bisynthesis [Pseudomonas oryzae]